jgi:Ca2+-binding EF-hand superfamily protein
MAMARDDDLVTMVKEKERTLFRKKLEEMFDGLDTNLDGYMTWSEFEVITQNQRWRSWADKLGIPMSDVEGLFEMLAGSDGRVSFKEFSYGIQRVKGPAKSVDMVWLLSQFGQMLESNRIIETRMLNRTCT